MRVVGTTELLGDYQPRENLIRVWMKTAVYGKTVAFGRFFFTLCHEFCHHLDCEQFKFPNSFHTRGFFERMVTLYHHAAGTPRVPPVWKPLRGERYICFPKRAQRSEPLGTVC
jgi:hypothetical protein